MIDLVALYADRLRADESGWLMLAEMHRLGVVYTTASVQHPELGFHCVMVTGLPYPFMCRSQEDAGWVARDIARRIVAAGEAHYETNLLQASEAQSRVLAVALKDAR